MKEFSMEYSKVVLKDYSREIMKEFSMEYVKDALRVWVGENEGFRAGETVESFDGETVRLDNMQEYRITEIHLTDAGLTGTLPTSDIQAFKGLQISDLGNNPSASTADQNFIVSVTACFDISVCLENGISCEFPPTLQLCQSNNTDLYPDCNRCNCIAPYFELFKLPVLPKKRKATAFYGA